eukprot:3236398-Alexandrium_andersonii.AAC.1
MGAPVPCDQHASGRPERRAREQHTGSPAVGATSPKPRPPGWAPGPQRELGRPRPLLLRRRHPPRRGQGRATEPHAPSVPPCAAAEDRPGRGERATSAQLDGARPPPLPCHVPAGRWPPTEDGRAPSREGPRQRARPDRRPINAHWKPRQDRRVGTGRQCGCAGPRPHQAEVRTCRPTDGRCQAAGRPERSPVARYRTAWR